MAAARKSNPVDEALKLGTNPLLFAGLFSLVSNVLYLSFPIYTNQVFTRVLSSHSAATLMVLTAGVLIVFALSSALDALRAKVLTNFGLVFDRYLAGPLFAALFETAVRRNPVARAQVVRDLDQFRQGVTGPATAVLFDVPFIPIFFFVLYLIDPLLGTLVLIGGAVLFVLALLQDRSTRAAINKSNDESVASYAFTEAALRNSEVVRALGMVSTLGVKWGRQRAIALDMQADIAHASGFYTNVIKMVRMGIQVLMIALSAYLIINERVQSGMLFANMILAARALAPIERVVSTWQVLVNSGQAYGRLKQLFAAVDPPSPATELPRPKGHLTVDRVNFTPPGSDRMLLAAVSLEIGVGQTLGIVGPSGAGKSTLMRLIVGVWRPLGGSIRLDGADVYTWDRTSFGKHVGYLPQDIELFAGTVRDNIARFRSDATDEQVIEAAKLAGAHDMFLGLSKGYDTEVGEGGAVLSGGQRQRVGFARAVFGNPSLVVLDEPNANLDAEGEEALLRALETMKARQVSVIIASHKPNIFRTSDFMVVMREGRVEAFGQRNEILAQLIKPAAPRAQEAKTG